MQINSLSRLPQNWGRSAGNRWGRRARCKNSGYYADNFNVIHVPYLVHVLQKSRYSAPKWTHNLHLPKQAQKHSRQTSHSTRYLTHSKFNLDNMHTPQYNNQCGTYVEVCRWRHTHGLRLGVINEKTPPACAGGVFLCLHRSNYYKMLCFAPFASYLANNSKQFILYNWMCFFRGMPFFIFIL